MWVELKKLVEIFRFLLATIYKSKFAKDLQSRKNLTRLYLLSQYARSRIPSVSLPISESDIYRISARHYADHDLDFENRFLLAESGDLFALIALVHRFKPKKIFEFGLARGGSLLHFFLNTDPEVTIDSLDQTTDLLLPDMHDMISRNSRLRIHHSDSFQFDPEPLKGKIDFIFVDGGHDYPTVKNDTLKALVMLRHNGAIVWDDYVPSCEGVFRFINEFSLAHPDVFHIKGTKLAYWVNAHQ